MDIIGKLIGIIVVVIGVAPIYTSYKIFTGAGVLYATSIDLYEFAGGAALNIFVSSIYWILIMVLVVLFAICGILWIRWGVLLITEGVCGNLK